MADKDAESLEYAEKHPVTAMSSARRLGMIVYTLTMMAYGVVTMAVAIAAYTNFDKIVTNYTYVVANFRNAPIVDLRLLTTETECKIDEVSIFNFTWAGTVEGCNCLDVAQSVTKKYPDVQKQLYNTPCSNNQTKYCEQILAKEPVIGNKFRDSSGSPIIICAKRLPDEYAFYKKAPSPENPACESSEKMCGVSEKPELQYCVPKKSQCPVQGMIAGNQNPDANSYDQIVPIDSEYNLYISRNLDMLPIAELRVSAGEGVCMENTKRNIDQGQIDYVLLKDHVPEACEIDTRFLAVLQLSELEYFTLNSVPYEELPAYDVTDEHKYISYYRNFLDWKYEERKNLKKLVENEGIVQTMRTSQGVVMGISVIACVLVSAILPISALYNLCKKTAPCFDGNADEQYPKIDRCKKIATYCAKLLQLPFAVWAYVLANRVQSFFAELAHAKPSDALTNKTLKDMSDTVRKEVYENDQSLIGVLIIVIIVDILVYLYERICNKKPVIKGSQGGNVEFEKLDDVPKSNNLMLNSVQNRNTQQQTVQQSNVRSTQQPQQATSTTPEPGKKRPKRAHAQENDNN